MPFSTIQGYLDEMEETSETSHLHLHLFASLEFIRNMFKPHAGVKVFFVDCFVDSRSYEASCSRWNRVLLLMARRTSCCLHYLRSRKEILFFVCSCGDFSVPLKQCDVLWRFFFDFRLSLSQFWPLFSDCSET